MNPNLERLEPYPFARLSKLLGETQAAELPHISLAMGEPRHPAPQFLIDYLSEKALLTEGLATYPPTRGLPSLRTAIASFINRRFKPAKVDPDRHLLPVNGTREALFAVAQALSNYKDRPITMMPNPFYQIYEGAALLAGTQPLYLPCTPETAFKPDLTQITSETWSKVGLIYICNPGNPHGALMTLEDQQALIALALEHQFIIVADECYSEIYQDEDNPPVGLLQAAAALGNLDFKQCLAFNSLSKRSNLPGLRSGYVAGDPELIARFLEYRTYHGSAMPVHSQMVSALAWQDEAHVQHNRAQYRAKIKAFVETLAPVWPIKTPDASFYLWPETPIDDEIFAQKLFSLQNVSVLPGRYLSRTFGGENPGINRIRIALVAEPNACLEAAQRIKSSFEDLS
jgi:N-succinyldiaminopimelate aminotransferase